MVLNRLEKFAKKQLRQPENQPPESEEIQIWQRASQIIETSAYHASTIIFPIYIADNCIPAEGSRICMAQWVDHKDITIMQELRRLEGPPNGG